MLFHVSHADEEKELLMAIMMSMDVQMEKVEDLLGLIDSGFSANQVVTAFESTKTLEIEILKNEITKETSGE